MFTTTKIHLQLICSQKNIEISCASIAEAIQLMQSVKTRSSISSYWKMQCLDLVYPGGWVWIDFDMTDRSQFVSQCQRMGLDMASDEILALLDRYFEVPND